MASKFFISDRNFILLTPVIQMIISAAAPLPKPHHSNHLFTCTTESSAGNDNTDDEDDNCWMYLKVPRVMKPKPSDYKAEVGRRWDHFVTSSTSPTSIPQRRQPKAWLIAKLGKWLDNYPINDPNDVLFLTKAAKDVTAGSMLVFNSKKAEKMLLEGSWTGTEPHLWFGGQQ